jgi:hypothetical protein
MSRHRLTYAGIWISIPIVFGAVTDQDAAKAFDRPNQIDSFHDTTRSSTLRIPGNSPLDKS